MFCKITTFYSLTTFFGGNDKCPFPIRTAMFVTEQNVRQVKCRFRATFSNSAFCSGSKRLQPSSVGMQRSAVVWVAYPALRRRFPPALKCLQLSSVGMQRRAVLRAAYPGLRRR